LLSDLVVYMLATSIEFALYIIFFRVCSTIHDNSLYRTNTKKGVLILIEVWKCIILVLTVIRAGFKSFIIIIYQSI